MGHYSHPHIIQPRGVLIYERIKNTLVRNTTFDGNNFCTIEIPAMEYTHLFLILIVDGSLFYKQSDLLEKLVKSNQNLVNDYEKGQKIINELTAILDKMSD